MNSKSGCKKKERMGKYESGIEISRKQMVAGKMDY